MLSKYIIRIFHIFFPYKYIEGVNFDKNYGVDTEKYVRRSFLGKVNGEKKLGSIYAATPMNFLEKTLSVIKDYDYKNFADIGCGKGRVIFYFADYYEYLVGVEYSKKLVDIANNNLLNLKKVAPLLSKIEFVYADAACYRLPFDRGIVYMFNSFDSSILDKFLKNNINGDYLYVYINPWHATTFLKNKFYCVREDSPELKVFKKIPSD